MKCFKCGNVAVEGQNLLDIDGEKWHEICSIGYREFVLGDDSIECRMYRAYMLAIRALMIHDPDAAKVASDVFLANPCSRCGKSPSMVTYDGDDPSCRRCYNMIGKMDNDSME